MIKSTLLEREIRGAAALGSPSGLPRVTTGGKRSRNNSEMLIQEEIKLVQSVFRVPSLDGPRVVVFSGVEHGNGCSQVCARAAETLSLQIPGSACVVDANLRSPALHRFFGLENLVGFTDIVVQTGPVRNFTQRIGQTNLWVLTCGFHSIDPHALLTSDRLRSRISELRAGFDFVLIDAPPVNLYSDAALLGRLADGLVLVVEANSNRRETTQRSKEALESANVRLLGAVLNKREFPIPEFVYRKL
jgi:protein-tyrosine kinase